jgi:hypothetical protein
MQFSPVIPENITNIKLVPLVSGSLEAAPETESLVGSLRTEKRREENI